MESAAIASFVLFATERDTYCETTEAVLVSPSAPGTVRVYFKGELAS
jgi:hypothetical protein